MFLRNVAGRSAFPKYAPPLPHGHTPEQSRGAREALDPALGLLLRFALTAMPPDLHIEVLHKAITVTMPGTSYTVTYYKPKDSRLLLAKHQSSTDDQRANVTLSEFLGSAWWAASERARELGWIV